MSSSPTIFPDAGLIRTMRFVCQTLAKTSPRMYSSSLRNVYGLPAALRNYRVRSGAIRTVTRLVSASVVGSQKCKFALPSDTISCDPSNVTPQPSLRVEENVKVLRRFSSRSYRNPVRSYQVSWMIVSL